MFPPLFLSTIYASSELPGERSISPPPACSPSLCRGLLSFPNRTILSPFPLAIGPIQVPVDGFDDTSGTERNETMTDHTDSVLGSGAGTGAGPPRQRRQRTRTGCLKCRVRRRKCDEGKPRCQRCIDGGL
ncbi:hypothetical protein LY76DRAFT_292834 [Colletotrichum caudatum]|nr:hypothetical protein LY76DRAFT_292834 [Colletotrichum caudatum]